MLIDAHFHSWQLARADYGWLTPALAPIYRDVNVPDWQAQAQAVGVTGGILVQAAPTEPETWHLLALADQHPSVLGVVGWVDWLARGTAELVRYWFSFHGLLREAAWSLHRAPEVARLLIDAHAHARLLLHRSPGFQGRACEVGVIEHFSGPTDPMNRAQALTLLRVLATGRLERPFALTGELPNGTPALDRVGLHWRGSAQGDVAGAIHAVWAVRCPLTLIGVGRTEAETAESAGVRTDHRLLLAPRRATLW